MQTVLRFLREARQAAMKEALAKSLGWHKYRQKIRDDHGGWRYIYDEPKLQHPEHQVDLGHAQTRREVLDQVQMPKNTPAMEEEWVNQPADQRKAAIAAGLNWVYFSPMRPLNGAVMKQAGIDGHAVGRFLYCKHPLELGQLHKMELRPYGMEEAGQAMIDFYEKEYGPDAPIVLMRETPTRSAKDTPESYKETLANHKKYTRGMIAHRSTRGEADKYPYQVTRFDADGHSGHDTGTDLAAMIGRAMLDGYTVPDMDAYDEIAGSDRFTEGEEKVKAAHVQWEKEKKEFHAKYAEERAGKLREIAPDPVQTMHGIGVDKNGHPVMRDSDEAEAARSLDLMPHIHNAITSAERSTDPAERERQWEIASDLGAFWHEVKTAAAKFRIYSDHAPDREDVDHLVASSKQRTEKLVAGTHAGIARMRAEKEQAAADRKAAKDKGPLATHARHFAGELDRLSRLQASDEGDKLSNEQFQQLGGHIRAASDLHKYAAGHGLQPKVEHSEATFRDRAGRRIQQLGRDHDEAEPHAKPEIHAHREAIRQGLEDFNAGKAPRKLEQTAGAAPAAPAAAETVEEKNGRVHDKIAGARAAAGLTMEPKAPAPAPETGKKAAVSFGDVSAIKRYKTTRKSLEESPTRELLSKAKGDMKPGHKYKDRHRDAQGNWVYEYDAPAARTYTHKQRELGPGAKAIRLTPAEHTRVYRDEGVDVSDAFPSGSGGYTYYTSKQIDQMVELTELWAAGGNGTKIHSDSLSASVADWAEGRVIGYGIAKDRYDEKVKDPQGMYMGGAYKRKPFNRADKPDRTWLDFDPLNLLPPEALWRLIDKHVLKGRDHVGRSIAQSDGWEMLNIYPEGRSGHSSEHLDEITRAFIELQQWGYVDAQFGGNIWSIEVRPEHRVQAAAPAAAPAAASAPAAAPAAPRKQVPMFGDEGAIARYNTTGTEPQPDDPRVGGKAVVRFGDKTAIGHYKTTRKSLGDSPTRELLRKAKKGDQAPGHKYDSRKPDGKGGWIYDYGDAGAAVPSHGDMLDGLVAGVGAYLNSGKPLQIGTMTKIFPLTNAADFRRVGDGVQFRFNGKWSSLTEEMAERLALAVGSMGPMSHARAGGTRPEPKPIKPSAMAIFDQFQQEMARFDEVYGQFKGKRADTAMGAIREQHVAEADAIALAYQRKTKISTAEASAALGAAKTIVASLTAMLPVKKSLEDRAHEVLHKAQKGEMAPGHKYDSRTWDDAAGHWVYHWRKGPGAHMTGEHIFALFEHNKNTRLSDVERYFRYGQAETSPDFKTHLYNAEQAAHGLGWAISTGRLPGPVEHWLRNIKGRALAKVIGELLPHVHVMGDAPAALIKLYGSDENQARLREWANQQATMKPGARPKTKNTTRKSLEESPTRELLSKARGGDHGMA